MVKGSVMKCSQCGNNNGHNLRTCIHSNNNSNYYHGNKGSLKLFGVKILMEKEFEAMKKSLSIGNLNSSSSSSSHFGDQIHADGYLSDGPVHNARRKGQPWMKIEHQLFLQGLHKLGKGDWKGIAKNFVITRTAAQVASHAQKHFLRMSTSDHKKKRPSVFDAPLLKDPSSSSSSIPIQPDITTVTPTVIHTNGIDPQQSSMIGRNVLHGYPPPQPQQPPTPPIARSNCSQVFPNASSASAGATPIIMNPKQQHNYVFLQTLDSDYLVGSGTRLAMDGPPFSPLQFIHHRYQPTPSFVHPSSIVANRDDDSSATNIEVPPDALELRLAPSRASDQGSYQLPPGPASCAIKVT